LLHLIPGTTDPSVCVIITYSSSWKDLGGFAGGIMFPLHIYADEIGRDARGDLKGLISADFEAEVEDAIEPIFRHGDDFQQGIEHVVFIKVRADTSQAGASGM
jgi:hypothetical protein